MRTSLGWLAFLAAALCASLTYLTWREGTLLARGSRTPQTVRLAELEERGPGDNIHVTVTGLQFGPHFAAEGQPGTWERVLIPVLPLSERPDAQRFRVLVSTDNARSPHDLKAFSRRERLTGVIMNSVAALTPGQIERLESNYPQTDFERVMILHEGRPFPSATTVYLLGGGAVVCLVLAAGCVAGLFRAGRGPRGRGRP